jgi:AAA ATPase domain
LARFEMVLAELTQARALGKVVLPVVCKPLGGQIVLPDIQALDLVDWNADGIIRLEERLRAISSELARGFPLDPNRPPYPGIFAFEAPDAAIFFGRDEESRAVIERLDARRTQGGARFVVIVGASGSGKSSLLKAGVLPQLSRRHGQWVLLPDIRPEKAPMEALAKALAQHRVRTAATGNDLNQASPSDARVTRGWTDEDVVSEQICLPPYRKSDVVIK